MTQKAFIIGLLSCLSLASAFGQAPSNPSPDRSEAVDLQVATLKDLEKRTPLDRIQAIRLLEYRREHAPLRSFYELYYLKGFNASLVQKLREFAFIKASTGGEGDSIAFLEQLERTKGRFRLRWGRVLQQRIGQLQGRYRGSPDALKGQLSLEVPGIASIGASIEKDPGEPWWDDKAKTPLSVAGHLKLDQQGPLRKAVIGGIDARSGGGLLVDSKGGFFSNQGPSSGALFSIDGYSGTPDRTPLKGIGAEFGFAEWKAGFVLSRKKWSARFDTLPSGKKGMKTLYRSRRFRKVRSPNPNGNWLRKDLMGFAGWKDEGSSFLLSVHHSQASHPPLRSGNIRDRYARNRPRTLGAELHYRGHHERKKWALSAAYERHGGKAFRAAFSLRPHSDILLTGRITGAGRKFDPFWSSVARDGRPFIRSSLRGDRSIAAGWRIALEGELLHRFWPYYGRRFPGTERSLNLRNVWSGDEERRSELELSYETQEQNASIGDTPSYPLQKEKALRAELSIKSLLIDGWKHHAVLKGIRTLDGKTVTGFLFIYDLIRAWEEHGVKFYWRTAFFDASTYRGRLYAYENDVLYAFSVRPYYRQGLRTYLLLRIELDRSLTMEGKWGSWIYQKVDGGRIGSGDRAIPGHIKSSLRLQLRASF